MNYIGTNFLGTIRNTIVTATFLGLLSCGTAYLIYLSLTRISCGLESILTITLEDYYKLIVHHDLLISLYITQSNQFYDEFFFSLGDMLQLGLCPVRLSGHATAL